MNGSRDVIFPDSYRWRFTSQSSQTPLLVDQSAGVVSPEPHRSAAAGQADALLDLVFAGGGGHTSCCRAGLRVVAPEAQHLHDLLLLQHLVDEAVLNVDAP